MNMTPFESQLKTMYEEFVDQSDPCDFASLPDYDTWRYDFLTGKEYADVWSGQDRIILASNKDHALSLIEQSKVAYRMKLGGKGGPLHADPVTLSIHFSMHIISIELTYTAMDSPIGFPFNRLICKLRLDGAPITLKQLKKELNND